MKRDVIVAALCVAISVILYAALGSIEEPRATIFPRVVILAIGGLSMLLLGQALLSGSADTPSDKPQYPWGRFLLLFALIATYFAIMETVGFYVSAFLFYVAVCLIFGRAEFTPRQGLLWTFSAAGLVAVLFVLFRIILEVQTPRGFSFDRSSHVADRSGARATHVRLALMQVPNHDVIPRTSITGTITWRLQTMSRLKAFGWLMTGGVILVLSSMGSFAFAEAYPDKPMSMIVSYEPGGATDFQARIAVMMAGQKEYMGQPVVIINKPGAGGQIGWDWFVTKGTKDGYTLAAYNVPHFIAQSIMFKTKFNINTFEPVGNWGADPAVLIVGKDSPFKTVHDLVTYAKANPGKVTVTGAGLYVGHHIAFLQLEKAAGIKMTYVPEKGGVPAMQSVIGGKVKAGINNLADAFRNQDRLRILAIADLERHAFLPEVKTFKELGIDVDDSSVNYRGVLLPKGAPKEVIAKCSDMFVKMFNDPQTLEKMKASGSPVKIMDRDAVIKMFQERENYLKGLLVDLKKNKQ